MPYQLDGNTVQQMVGGKWVDRKTYPRLKDAHAALLRLKQSEDAEEKAEGEPPFEHSTEREGTVTGINRDWDDQNTVRVSVEHAAPTGGAMPGTMMDSHSHYLPKAHAGKLKVGDKVRVHSTICKL